MLEGDTMAMNTGKQAFLVNASIYDPSLLKFNFTMTFEDNLDLKLQLHYHDSNLIFAVIIPLCLKKKTPNCTYI